MRWVVAALVVAGGCSYESEWRPRARDATLDEAEAPRDTTSDLAADMAEAGDAGMDAAEAPVDAEVGADVAADETGLDADADVPSDLGARDEDVAEAMDVAGDDFPETLVVEAGVDVLSDAVCADACAVGESCFAGSCRVQRSCAATDADAGCGVLAIPGTGDMPGSGFTMGGTTPERGGRLLDGVRVSGFSMDTHEVTVARFRVFWNSGAPELPARQIVYPNRTVVPTIGWAASAPTATTVMSACNWSDMPGTRENHPINCVDPKMAQAFCYWDAGGDGGGGRLPTSAEWEYAAVGRHRDGRSFPWGGATPMGACADGGARLAHVGCPGGSTVRVNSLGAGSGLADLIGNVGEWVADARGSGDYNELCWWSAGPMDPLCVSAPGGGRTRVARGGAFSDTPLHAAQLYAFAEGPDATVGFRCVRSPGAPAGDLNNAGAACTNGSVRCSGACDIDPMSDDYHCGRCDYGCGSGRRCVAGRCVEAQTSCADAGTPGCGMTLVRGGVPYEILPGDQAGQGTARVAVGDFALDTYEVTVARFQAFHAAAFRAPATPIRYPNGAMITIPAVQEPLTESSLALCNWMATPARGDHPINCVSKDTAQAFCAWDGARSDARNGRLPTRAEWEYAARGVERVGFPALRRWPWGDENDVCNRARLGLLAFCGTMPGGVAPDGTRSVGAAVAGPLYRPYGGFFDLIGNLSEWTPDITQDGADITACWGEGLDAGVPMDPVCLTATTPFRNISYITGGGFDQSYEFRNLGRRGGSGAGSGPNTGIGIRCARTLRP